VNAYIPSVKHLDSQIKAWKKSDNAPNWSVPEGLFERLIGPTARLGHELRTQQWPSQYLADIKAFETYATALRMDLQQITRVDPSTWQQNFNIDIDSWSTAGEAVAQDLNVTVNA
jgi:hypothetical protein